MLFFALDRKMAKLQLLVYIKPGLPDVYKFRPPSRAHSNLPLPAVTYPKPNHDIPRPSHPREFRHSTRALGRPLAIQYDPNECLLRNHHFYHLWHPSIDDRASISLATALSPPACLYVSLFNAIDSCTDSGSPSTRNWKEEKHSMIPRRSVSLGPPSRVGLEVWMGRFHTMSSAWPLW